MTDLRRRVAAAERALGRPQQGILRVVIVNDPEGLDVDDGQSAPSQIGYCRLPDETVGVFRERAAKEAEARGERMIFFGEQEPREPSLPLREAAEPNGFRVDRDG